MTRKYNPPTKTWTVKPIKRQKEYIYLPLMMAKIFHRMRFLQTKLADQCEMDDDDPRKIAPTIGHSQPLSTKELLQKRKSRWTK